MRNNSLQTIALTIASVFCLATFSEAREFKIIGTPDQITQIEQSLSACQSLASKLDTLVTSAKFHQIRITTADDARKNGPFLAYTSKSEIILADSWLYLQNTPLYDVRRGGEILPDNLCFALGHLADHIENPPPQITNIDKVDLSDPSAMNRIGEKYINQMMIRESLAFIRGWSYVVEAARAKNNNHPISPAQIADLFINLRYRFAFLPAMAPNATQKLNIMMDGRIPETEANIAAVGFVLSHSNMADIQ